MNVLFRYDCGPKLAARLAGGGADFAALGPQAADALWSVLRDADGAARMGRAGMAVTRDQDWDRVAARILAMAPGAKDVGQEGH